MSQPSPKKILFLTYWWPTEADPLNGNYVKEHARAALVYNNEVVVMQILGCARSIKGLYELLDEQDGAFRVIRVKYKKSPLPKSSYLSYLLSAILAFRWLVTKGGFRPEVIHAHVFSVGVLAVILRKIFRTPVVITEHYAGFLENRLNKRERIEVRFAMNRVDMILPVSSALKKAIIRCGVTNRFQVIANTVNMNSINPADLVIGQEGNRKKILFMGSLVPRKGLVYLLEALAGIVSKRDDFELDIVGDGPEKEKCEEIVLHSGLGKAVRFQGVVTDAQRDEFFRRCSFLVLPTLWESFGVVLIEAMAWGKPVIGTTCDAVKELISDKAGILVPPGDPRALRGAIERMLDGYKGYSPEEINRYAYERFSYEAVGAKLDRIYEELISLRLKR